MPHRYRFVKYADVLVSGVPIAGGEAPKSTVRLFPCCAQGEYVNPEKCSAWSCYSCLYSLSTGTVSSHMDKENLIQATRRSRRTIQPCLRPTLGKWSLPCFV